MPAIPRIIFCVGVVWLAVTIFDPVTVSERRGQMLAQEVAAIFAIRTIHTTQVQFYSQFGRFAASLKELGPTGGTKSGYKFTMTGNASGYVIHGDPETYGKSGSRTFYSDQTMVIRQNYGQEPATINSPELKN